MEIFNSNKNMNFPFYVQCFYALAKKCLDYSKAQKKYSYFPLEVLYVELWFIFFLGDGKEEEVRFI